MKRTDGSKKTPLPYAKSHKTELAALAVSALVVYNLAHLSVGVNRLEQTRAALHAAPEEYETMLYNPDLDNFISVERKADGELTFRQPENFIVMQAGWPILTVQEEPNTQQDMGAYYHPIVARADVANNEYVAKTLEMVSSREWMPSSRSNYEVLIMNAKGELTLYDAADMLDYTPTQLRTVIENAPKGNQFISQKKGEELLTEEIRNIRKTAAKRHLSGIRDRTRD